MSKINPTFLDRTNLVWEWLLDWDATDTWWSNNGTASNVTWVASERGYTSETADFNWTTSDIEKNPTNTFKNSAATICFWMNPDTIPTWSANADIVLRYQTNNTWLWPAYWWQFQTYDGQVRFDLKTNTGSSLTTLIWAWVTVWEWDFITVTYNASNVYIYKNGVEVTNTTWATAVFDTNMQLILGCFESLWTKTRHYNWKIALARIYDAVISQSRIEDLYQEWLRQFWPTKELQSYKAIGSPTAYYPLNWDANDYVWSYNWTANNVTYSPVWWWNAATFNWTNADIDVAHNTDFNITSPWATVSQWIKTTATWDISYAKRNSTDTQFYELWQDVSWTLLWRIKVASWTDITKNGEKTINDWDWHFIVWTYNGSTMNYYCDWVEVWTWSSLSWDVSNTTWVTIWSRSNYTPATAYWSWDIALTTFYKSALSADDITQLYNQQSKWVIWNKYSLANLRDWLVLDISKAQVSNTYYDQSWNGNNWTDNWCTDSVLWLNNVMTLNGTSNDVDVASASNLNIISPWVTVAQWIKTTATWDISYAKRNTTDTQFYELWQDVSWTLLWRIKVASWTDITKNGEKTINDWDWHFIVWTYNGSTMNYYCDWVEVWTWSSLSWDVSNTTWVTIWSRSNYTPATAYWSWDIANTMVFNRPLSAEEIQQLYYSNFITN